MWKTVLVATACATFPRVVWLEHWLCSAGIGVTIFSWAARRTPSRSTPSSPLVKDESVYRREGTLCSL